jgi:D-mannonate dehydratase
MTSPHRVADNSEFHSSPEAFGHMSPHCRFSDLCPFRKYQKISKMQNGEKERKKTKYFLNRIIPLKNTKGVRVAKSSDYATQL